MKDTVIRQFKIIEQHALDFFRLASKFLFYYRGHNQLSSFLFNVTATTLQLVARQQLQQQQDSSASMSTSSSSSSTSRAATIRAIADATELRPESVADLFVLTCLRTLTSIRNETVLLHYLGGCVNFRCMCLQMHWRTCIISFLLSFRFISRVSE